METVEPVEPVELAAWATIGVVVMVMQIMATTSTHEDTQTIEAGYYVQLITGIHRVLAHIVLVKAVTKVRVFNHRERVHTMIVNRGVYVPIDIVLVVAIRMVKHRVASVLHVIFMSSIVMATASGKLLDVLKDYFKMVVLAVPAVPAVPAELVQQAEPVE